MLTVILLVVLAGGVGLLAVWSVDPDGLRRMAGQAGNRSLRVRLGYGTPPPAPAGERPAPAPGDDRAAPTPVLEVVAAPTAAPELAPAGGPAPRFAPIEVPALPGPARRRRRGSVPAAFTAVEGSYRDVAVSPVWRRALSLVLLAVVLVGVGVVLTAVAAAALGAVGELVNGAVG